MTAHTRGDLLSKRGTAVITDNLTFVGTGGVDLLQATLRSGSTVIIDTGGGINSAVADGQLDSVSFHRLNLTTNLAAVVIPISGGNTTNAEFLMPRAGSIIGMAIQLSTAAGTGTVDVWPTINGTTQASLLCHLNAATTAIKRQKAAAVAKNAVAVAQFQRVGMKITTSSNFAPTTIDFMGTIYLEI